jgi:competence protein ComEA
MKLLKALLLAVFLGLSLANVYAASVDINTADAKTLETLRGIGPKSAQAIVEYRQKNGPFKNLDDLDKVKGVGKKTIEKNRTKMTVGPAKKN